MTPQSLAGPAIRVQGLEESYGKLEVLCGAELRRGAGHHLRPARLQQGGQDHDHEDPRHAPEGRRGDGRRQWLRRRHATGERAGVHQPHRAFAAVDGILSARENLVLVARLRRLKDPGAIADDLPGRFSRTRRARAECRRMRVGCADGWRSWGSGAGGPGPALNKCLPTGSTLRARRLEVAGQDLDGRAGFGLTSELDLFADQLTTAGSFR
jgi:hypothetical protein